MTLTGAGEAVAKAYVIERVFGSDAGEQIRPLGRSTRFGIKKWKAGVKEAGKIRAKVAITVRKAKTEQIYERRRVATKSLDVLHRWGVSQEPCSHKLIFVLLATEHLKAFRSKGVFIHKLQSAAYICRGSKFYYWYLIHQSIVSP